MNEDFERALELDQMYLIEYQKEIEEQWQQWEEEHRLPAKIEIMSKKKRNASTSNSYPYRKKDTHL